MPINSGESDDDDDADAGGRWFKEGGGTAQYCKLIAL